MRGLSFKAIIELAAPHTWGASIVPVVLAAAFSLALHGRFAPLLFYSLLLTSIFLQCAVNTFNDYADFVKGVDTPENSDDPTDASIIYNRLDPKLAFCAGGAFLFLAFASGLYAIYTAGPVLVLFGAAGVAIVLLYSFGRSPISHLPLGELVSGVAMGGVIPQACVYAFTGLVDWRIPLLSIPVIFTIGLIMLTNNGSDIERDSQARRCTLPVFIGRRSTMALHVVLTLVSMAVLCAAVLLYFRKGAFLLPLAVPLAAFPESRILRGGLTPGARTLSMQNIIRLHWRLGFLYALMAAASALPYISRPMDGTVLKWIQMIIN
ncbi:MAG: prenyltransferase [Clostridiales Family XIII bacterium]|jgi:1,4-dihydroxy-2-naphthoate octaprenyltransferase|nr:prenyltransferase [Clostridiales Family XIII bacterium]